MFIYDSYKKGLSQPVRLNYADLQVFLVWYMCSWIRKNLMVWNGCVQLSASWSWKTWSKQMGAMTKQARDRVEGEARETWWEIQWGEERMLGQVCMVRVFMNMVHVYWSTEGDTRRISSLQRQWDTVSQKCSFTTNAELILETGENERRNNDWFKLWRKLSRRNGMVGSLKEHHGFDTSSITHKNYKKTDIAS